MSLVGLCCTNADCAGGLVCVDNACTVCTQDADCAGGQKCCSRICHTATCCDRSDCSQGLVCIDHICQACSDDIQCGAGEKCCSSQCTTGACCTDADCPGGLVCQANECTNCTADTDCGSGRKCCAGVCRAGDCCDNTDCPGAEICEDYTCQSCATDAQCGAGQKCCLGRCVIGDCCFDTDCPSGMICRNHTCWNCTNDADCQPPEICCDGLCIIGDCCDNTDCAGGLVCTNNFCTNCVTSADCSGTNPTCCSGLCVDLARDSMNCGSCGATCQPSQWCDDPNGDGLGTCTCLPSFMDCGLDVPYPGYIGDLSIPCTNLFHDPLNCGSCGLSCFPFPLDPYPTCNKRDCWPWGECIPPLMNFCDSQMFRPGSSYCTDFVMDPLNCGGCYAEFGEYHPRFVCQSFEFCVNGMCQAFRETVACTGCPCNECDSMGEVCCTHPWDVSRVVCVNGGVCPVLPPYEDS